MVIRHDVEGYDKFCDLIKELEGKKLNIFCLFSGSLDADGNSWCPDCVEAEPVVEKAVSGLDDTVLFVHVGVGDRAVWKDPNCSFRKDDRLRLTCVPTMIRWRGPERLEDADCSKSDLVEMLFEDFI